MIYQMLKNVISMKDYTSENKSEKEEMLNKLDVFLTFSRINEEQYKELHNLVEPSK